MFKREELPYRHSTLAIISDKNGKFLIVNKLAYEPDMYWAFPGGGVEVGETELEAVRRELVEELKSDQFKILDQNPQASKYEWPDEVIESFFQNRGQYFRGTELTLFWVKFTGKENEVEAGDGIRRVKWITREELKDHLLFPNQLETAEKMIQEFTK